MTAKTPTPAADKVQDTAAAAPADPTYFAVRDFRDAGTEAQFAKGDEVKATKGALTNYAAAGLVVTDLDTVLG